MRGASDRSQFIGQESEGHKAAEFGVLGLVDNAHPTAAQLLDDAVVRDGLADQFERDSTPVG